MNGNIIMQLGLVIIAVVIVISFIQPTFLQVATLQDDIFAVDTAAQQATRLNNELQAKVAQSQAISTTNLEALDTFLPDAVDELGVMSDLNQIAEMARVSLLSLEAAETENTPRRGTQLTDIDPEEYAQYQQLDGTDFSFTVAGQYADLKRFLALMGQNEYPMQITQLTSGESVGENESSNNTQTSDSLENSSTVTFAIEMFVPRFTPANTTSEG